MDRLFVVINRINSILLLLALVGVCVLLGWASWSSAEWHRRGAIEVADVEGKRDSPVFLHLEHMEDITGANAQMMLLSARAKSGKFSSGSGYDSETRNVLFLAGEEKKARWLFPAQNNLVLAAKQLREDSIHCDKKPTKALYFEYVAEDSDGDGKLSDQDHSTVALSKPDGSGFVVVLNGVSRILSHELLNDQYISVVYQTGKSVRHARFSVSSLTKETDQEIADVPDHL
jgi:hypothetical protein